MAANDDDGQRTYFVPSLRKTAYHACNLVQRNMYIEWKLPAVDLQDCCRRLFQILELSAKRGEYDPLGDRHEMLIKIRPLHVMFEIFEKAATHGHKDCLRFAHEITNPWLPRFDAQTCTNAAQAGHVECLQYAHEIGCRWDTETCTEAAKGGHLSCLRFAHENGCPWDETTLIVAKAYGRRHCLAYAHEQGCPN